MLANPTLSTLPVSARPGAGRRIPARRSNEALGWGLLGGASWIGEGEPDARSGERSFPARPGTSLRLGDRVGWTFSGILGRSGKSWRILEAWTVYPA